MRELAAIGERLQSVDPVLADHLNSLDIPPQLYGITVHNHSNQHSWKFCRPVKRTRKPRQGMNGQSATVMPILTALAASEAT
ncbi:hypothetical protein TELCIR_04858 [Teladorsagia circumcincta]|uniref:Uncharacterized protein n=1 Tax=Teladorsagia circumcincta TaxID=45464 RepID=A0A2G9USE5_TELCI|nr:hypothetical protein TELCIR_04858 [Teladorsagia circumcincta]